MRVTWLVPLCQVFLSASLCVSQLLPHSFIFPFCVFIFSYLRSMPFFFTLPLYFHHAHINTNIMAMLMLTVAAFSVQRCMYFTISSAYLVHPISSPCQCYFSVQMFLFHTLRLFNLELRVDLQLCAAHLIYNSVTFGLFQTIKCSESLLVLVAVTCDSGLF
jgi:hypothetical protein